MAKLKAVHAEDLQRREDLALKAEEQSSDPEAGGDRRGPRGAGADARRSSLGEAGLLHPPPLAAVSCTARRGGVLPVLHLAFGPTVARPPAALARRRGQVAGLR